MAILPSKNQTQSAALILADLKKGDKEKRNEFVWMHQERFYAIAFMATGDPEHATQLTIMAFQNAFANLRQLNVKQVTMPLWEWLSLFIVDACAEYHAQYSAPIVANSRTDPSADGSAQMDWETTIILGVQRVRRCLMQLPEEQQKVFLLRHAFQLNYDQIGTVCNQATETVKAWLFRARVQIVKCLGRG
jgi:RNA polymerase sigma factor (sigma-70 family)